MLYLYVGVLLGKVPPARWPGGRVPEAAKASCHFAAATHQESHREEGEEEEEKRGFASGRDAERPKPFSPTPAVFQQQWQQWQQWQEDVGETGAARDTSGNGRLSRPCRRAREFEPPPLQAPAAFSVLEPLGKEASARSPWRGNHDAAGGGGVRVKQGPSRQEKLLHTLYTSALNSTLFASLLQAECPPTFA